MDNVRAALIAFTAACVTDVLMAAWVAAVAMGERWRAAALSMAVASSLLAGLGQVRRSRWAGAAWVLGYGVGSWIAVTMAH